jgi:hypothetical protein
MQDIAFITEEPICNQVEEDTWSSVTITQRKVATKNFTSPLQPNRIRSSPLFRSPGKLQKFKNLLQEAGGSIGGSNETGSHVGFSAPSRSQDDVSSRIRWNDGSSSVLTLLYSGQLVSHRSGATAHRQRLLKKAIRHCHARTLGCWIY